MNMQPHEEGDIPLLPALAILYKQTLSHCDWTDFAFTKTQLFIFAALLRREEMTMSEVAKSIHSSKEQATRAVAPLVDGGYVERSIPRENRTRVYVRLTGSGRALVEDFLAGLRRNINARLSGAITAEERRELSEAVNTTIRILSKLD